MSEQQLSEGGLGKQAPNTTNAVKQQVGTGFSIITVNMSSLNSQVKRHRLLVTHYVQKQVPFNCYHQKKIPPQGKRAEKIYFREMEQAGSTIVQLDRFKPKSVRQDQKQ